MLSAVEHKTEAPRWGKQKLHMLEITCRLYRDRKLYFINKIHKTFGCFLTFCLKYKKRETTFIFVLQN